MARPDQDTLQFDSLHLEGGLFVPAILDTVARGDGDHQRISDYQLPKGLSLTDEHGRAFRIATALWKNFDTVRARTDVDPHAATIGYVQEILRDALGYADIQPVREPIELYGLGYRVTFMMRGRVPVIVAPHDLGLDTPDERFAVVNSGNRRRSVHQLAQQFLNACASSTWAIVTNGQELRLLRDADTLTRPAFLSVDLDLILRAGRYADFAAAWRILHASRAGDPAAAGSDCIWERWKQEGHLQGQRVRSAMRTGVTEALRIFGNGFLQHRDNSELHRAFESGELTADGYFQELLRLVYRLLFIFTLEERNILHEADDSPPAREARQAYEDGFSMRRLRGRSLRRKGFDRFNDLWDGVRIVFRALAHGEERLALPALGGLFAQDQCPHLDASRLDNRALLSAMRQLRWSAASGQLTAIDYRNMGPEELGSVYESLLELVPEVRMETRDFDFIGLDEGLLTAGNARKESGSYYTSDALVQELLDSALDPVMEDRLRERPDEPVAALLSLNIIDPACGSGHFLLGAARRLAEKLTELRALDGAVRAEDYYHSLREVIAHCIYGVDRNPMALELARTALWLEGYEPGRPLSFLDHHLVCGDALLGLMDVRQLQHGIPKDAYKALSGDDKAVVKDLAALNRNGVKDLQERLKERTLRLFADQGSEDAFNTLQRIEAMPDESTDAIEEKKHAYAHYLQEARGSTLAQAANLYTAAFLAEKSDAEAAKVCPTSQTLVQILYPEQDSEPPQAHIDHAVSLCQQARVLHWPLAFAQVMGQGGFDCVLGNPPWEVSQLGEEEFFAARAPEIANLAGAKRKKAIEDLQLEHPPLWEEYIKSKRYYEAVNTFFRSSGRFPFTAKGKVNTYQVFAETNMNLAQESGYAGFIVPTGIATDDSTKDYFAHLAQSRRLRSLYDFENREGIFPGVHRSYKFCLMTLGPAQEAAFAFFLTRTEQLADERRKFALSAEDFQLINPNTLTCPVFRSQADAELTKKIYRNVPVLIIEAREDQPEENPWNITFSQGLFNMTSA